MLCTEQPAPASILLLVKCSCQKGCNSKRYSCVSGTLPCTDLCGCSEDCQNVAINESTSDVKGIYDDSDSDESEGEGI